MLFFLYSNVITPITESKKNSLEFIHICLTLYFIKIVEGDNNYNLIQQLKCKFHKLHLFMKNFNAKSDTQHMRLS